MMCKFFIKSFDVNKKLIVYRERKPLVGLKTKGPEKKVGIKRPAQISKMSNCDLKRFI